MKPKTAILVFISLLLFSCAILARTTLSNLLKGHVHFPDEYVGQVLTMDDGMKFTVFNKNNTPSLRSNMFFQIVQDKDSIIWISTIGNGIVALKNK